jgi:uncharacterized protein YihD (DUF1040 family)
MREFKRIPRILKLIQDYWEDNPDQRFGQVLINLGFPDSLEVWSYEDEDWEKMLESNSK